MEVIFINNNESFEDLKQSNNNESCVLKGRVDSTLFEVLKQILNKKKMTQQDLIESAVKDFVLKNLSLIIPNDKGSK